MSVINSNTGEHSMKVMQANGTMNSVFEYRSEDCRMNSHGLIPAID